jgi:hypothetical protein
MLPVLLLAFQLPVGLPAVLEEWKAEIEHRQGYPVVILRLPGDPVPVEDQEVLGSYFARADFARAFAEAQALTFRYEKGGAARSLILLNVARIQATQNSPAVLIAHELGHAWLASLGLKPPVYEPGPEACLAVHAGDIVQHRLIRAESDRREIAWRPAYIRDYTAALESLRKAAPEGPGDRCRRAQRVSLMMDLRDGFAPYSFAGREEYLDLLGRQDPAGEALAIELMEALDGRVELEADSYAAALRLVREALGSL